MFKLAAVEQKLFDYIKRIVAHKNLLTYLYFNEQFGIHMYASE